MKDKHTYLPFCLPYLYHAGMSLQWETSQPSYCPLTWILLTSTCQHLQVISLTNLPTVSNFNEDSSKKGIEVYQPSYTRSSSSLLTIPCVGIPSTSIRNHELSRCDRRPSCTLP